MAQYANQRQKKELSTTDVVLEQISDPSVRAFVGAIFAEYRKLLGEVTLLKSKPVTIDMRPKEPAIGSGAIQVLPSISNFTTTEIAALKHAISEDLMKEQGRIKRGVRTIFQIGFAHAIKKVLDSTAT